MKRNIFLSAAALVIGLYACNNQQHEAATATPAFSLDSVKTAIAAANKTYGESFGKKDSAGFVSHYTSDAVIMPSGMPRMSGSAAIGGFFKASVDMGVHGIDITTDELIGGPDGVAEIGKYDVKDSSGKSLDKGKFIVVWKKDGDKWKMHRDIWNTDGPPPAAEPAKK